MPPINQIHIDQALTNISIMYRNDQYMADSVFPILPVMKRSDKYFTYRKEDFLSGSGLDAQGRPFSLRAPGTEAAEKDYQQGTALYFAEEYAQRGIVTDAEYAYADSPLAPEIDQTEQLTQTLKIDNEMAVAGRAMTRANYPASNKVALTAGATGTSWANYAGVTNTPGSYYSNPFQDIKNAKLAVRLGALNEANRMALTIGAAKTLADHPLVKELVKYVSPDALTREGLPKVMRGLDIVEMAAVKNNSAEGGGFAGNYIFAADDGTDAALIFYNNPSPGLRSVAFGYTFEAPDDTSHARGFAVRKWREDKRKGTMVEVSVLRDWKFIAVDANGLATGGYLISSATV